MQEFEVMYVTKVFAATAEEAGNLANENAPKHCEVTVSLFAKAFKKVLNEWTIQG